MRAGQGAPLLKFCGRKAWLLLEPRWLAPLAAAFAAQLARKLPGKAGAPRKRG